MPIQKNTSKGSFPRKIRGLPATFAPTGRRAIIPARGDVIQWSDPFKGFKVFRRDVFKDFDYTSKAFEIEIEIIANTLRKGYRVVEVSSHERARAGGEMKSSVVRHGTRFLLRIFWEGFKGVKPRQAEAPKGLPANVDSVDNVRTAP